MNELGVPLPPNPVKTDFDIGATFESGEISRWQVEGDDWTLEIVVTGSESTPRLRSISHELPFSEGLWTAVHWARQYGVPGVCREELRHIEQGEEVQRYRLGALYMYAGFELTERERDYYKYGENPEII